MNTPVDHLSNISILNLDFDIWSGKVKLKASDIKLGAGGEIPPEKLAQLGQKKVIDSDKLRPFLRLKTSARRLCLEYGMSFINCFAIPTNKVDNLIKQLDEISVQMSNEKRQFINEYDASVNTWINENPEYAQIIRASVLPKVVVEQRINFDYQIFNINPVNNEQTKKFSTMTAGLGDELLEEITSEANDFFHRNINARTSCQASTRKTLLRLRNKVDGLSFLDSKFLSVVLLLDETLKAYGTVASKVEGSLFYQLMACVLILSSKDKLQSYAKGSINIDSMASGFMLSAKNDDTEIFESNTIQTVTEPKFEIETEITENQENKKTVNTESSDTQLPDDDDLDSYFNDCGSNKDSASTSVFF